MNRLHSLVIENIKMLAVKSMFENVHEALQFIAVEAGKGNVYTETISDLAEVISQPIRDSVVGRAYPELEEILESLDYMDEEFNPYDIARIIDFALVHYETELRELV